MIEFIATPTLSQDIKPGQAFSTSGPSYWDTAAEHGTIGERVYLRTNSPTPPDQVDEALFVITTEEVPS